MEGKLTDNNCISKKIFEKNGDLREDRQFFQAALADMFHILTYISLSLRYLYLYLFSISDAGAEVYKKTLIEDSLPNN